MLRDPVAGKATNCVPSEFPQDIYQDVADATTAQLVEYLKSDEIHTYPRKVLDPETGKRVFDENPPKDRVAVLAANWLKFCGGAVPRAATKRAVMTMPYGLRRFSALKYVAAWYRETRAAGRESPWGDSDAYLPCLWFGGLIWNNILETVKRAHRAMTWLRSCAKILSDVGVSARWTAPSGFPVIQSYPKLEGDVVNNMIGDKVRKLKFRRVQDGVLNMNAATMQNGIAPNFVHSIDAAAVVKTVNRAVDEGISSFAMIHDSYATVAADAPVLQRITREVYSDIFSGNLLDELRTELQALLPDDVQLPPAPEQGDLDPRCVIESPYFFQ